MCPTVVALLVPLVLPAQQGAAARSPDSLRVRAVAEGIVVADNDRLLERAAGYCAPDAVLLPPNEPPVAGIPAIRRRYQALLRDFHPEIEGTIEDLVVADGLAYVRGRNGGWLRGRHGAPDRQLNDVYLMVLRRRPSGEWLISRLIWHSAGATAAP